MSGATQPIECGDRYVFRVSGEEEARVYYCSQPVGHSGAHVELELMWPADHPEPVTAERRIVGAEPDGRHLDAVGHE